MTCISAKALIIIQNQGRQVSYLLFSFFKVFLYSQGSNWEKAYTKIDQLPRVYYNELKNTEFVEFTELKVARYLKFVVESFHGTGGGLSYIRENHAGIQGESYPGLKIG